MHFVVAMVVLIENLKKIIKIIVCIIALLQIPLLPPSYCVVWTVGSRADATRDIAHNLFGNLIKYGQPQRAVLVMFGLGIG